MPLKQQLTPLPFTQVQLHDVFWAPRMLANRSATLPAEYAQLESTGRLAALALACKPGAGNPPHIFWDSDIAKWIEAAAYALTRLPRSLMRSRIRGSMQSLRALRARSNRTGTSIRTSLSRSGPACSGVGQTCATRTSFTAPAI